MPKAPASGRAAGHVHLSFSVPLPGGMEVPISIPVSLYSGTTKAGVDRNQFVHTEDGDHQVGSQNYDKVTGDIVAYGDIIKKVNTEYGPVYVEDDEIERLFEIAPNSVVVKAFQPIHLFRQGHYVPKGLAFVEPTKTGSGAKKAPDPNSVKVLNALFAAMRDKGACAVVEVTTRGVPKPAVLLPDGTLWFLFHTEELREQRPIPEYEPSEGDIASMTLAIEGKWSTEVLDLEDTRSALIQAFADEKAQAGDFDKPDVSEVVATPAAVPNDLLASLVASVEQAKAKSEAV